MVSSKRVEPKNLLNKFGIELSNTGISENHLIETLKELALYTPKTSGKLFFNQLFGGLNSKSCTWGFNSGYTKQQYGYI